MSQIENDICLCRCIFPYTCHTCLRILMCSVLCRCPSRLTAIKAGITDVLFSTGSRGTIPEKSVKASYTMQSKLMRYHK